jgi:hypothetical protein
MPSYSTADLNARLNLSKAKSDYYLAQNIIRSETGATGRGVPRTFRPEDIMVGGVMAELDKYKLQSATLFNMSASLYRGVDVGLAADIDFSLMPQVYPHRMFLDGFGEYFPLDPDIAPEAAMLAEILDHDEAADLETYYYLMNPAYLLPNPPQVIVEFSELENGNFSRVIRDPDQPPHPFHVHRTSWVSVSLTKLAQRIFAAKPKGTHHG